MDFVVTCPCCADQVLMAVTNASLAAWQAIIARNQVSQVTCNDCGCRYNPADGGGAIGQSDVSAPSITSIGTATGSTSGGTSVSVLGHALSIGTLAVKFDGVAGTGVVVADDTHATVVTPAVPARVRTQGLLVGALSPGNSVTGHLSGKTGLVVAVGHGFIQVSGLNGALTPSEWLKKDDSNKIQVAAASIYAPCAVSVQNEFGSCAAGSSLVDAFTFTG